MIIKPLPAPHTIYWRALALAIVAWLLALFVTGQMLGLRAGEPFLFGLAIGTVFQFTVLAAAWSALGPGKLLWRTPGSLVWASVMGLAFALPVALDAPDLTPATVFMLVNVSLWLVALLPLWLTAVAFQLRLRYQAETVDVDATKERQFGIGQLMIFTAFVAIVAAIGKLVVSSKMIPDPDREVVMVMSILVVTQVLISLPLIFAGLLQRRVALATVIGIVFVAIVTVVEHMMLRQVLRGVPRAQLHVLTWGNIFSVLWVLAFIAIVRGSGYRFGLPQPDQGIQYVSPLQYREPRRLPEKLPEIVFLPQRETSPPNPTPPEGIIHIQE